MDIPKRTYEETLNYLFYQLPMFQRIGPAAFKKDLSNISALCQALENPQHQFRSIHLAGTNGKGSTAHMLAAVLQAAGYKVGLYTSPHYRDFRERIKINGQYILQDRVVAFVDRHEALFQTIQPSFFEITVAMAFSYFAEEKVDNSRTLSFSIPQGTEEFEIFGTILFEESFLLKLEEIEQAQALQEEEERKYFYEVLQPQLEESAKKFNDAIAAEKAAEAIYLTYSEGN